MVKSLTVKNVLGATKKMVLNDPELSGILITDIDGIGADKAIIYTTDYASIDGAFFNSSRIPQRDINLTLKPLWTKSGTVEDHRLEIYKFFPIRQKVTLTFETDNRVAEIVGYVEKNAPSIFSDDERISITVTCPDPYFYDAARYEGITTTSFNSTTPEFSFEMDNSLDNNTIQNYISGQNKHNDTLKEQAKIFSWDNSSSTIPDKDRNSKCGLNNTFENVSKYSIFGNAITDTYDRANSVDVPEDTANVEWFDNNIRTLTDNDIFDLIPYFPAGTTSTKLTVFYYKGAVRNSVTGEIFKDSAGHSFTVSDFNGIFSTINSKEYAMTLKYSDGRFYIQKVFQPRDEIGWRKLLFGEKEIQLERVIIYKGDVPIGLKFVIDFLGSVKNFKIYNVDTRSTMSFYDDRLQALDTKNHLGFRNGDQVVLNTVKGDKYIYLNRGGQKISLLNCINVDAEWFELNVGDNVFSYACDNYDAIEFTLINRTAYIGI